MKQKRIVRKYQSKVVAIIDSMGETSIKNAVSLLLDKYFTVWGSSGNLNTGLGAASHTVGDLADEMKKSAVSSGMNIGDISNYNSNKEAIYKLKSIIKSRDFIFIKG